MFPGERRVWLAGAVAAILLTIVGAYQLLRPRDVYTGTESVRTWSVSVSVDTDDELCVPVSLPEGTGRVIFDFLGPAEQPPLDLRVFVPGREPLSGHLPAGPAAPHKLVFDIAKTPAEPETVAASACVTPRGRLIDLGGMLGPQGGIGTPQINGELAPTSVAVWFRPPADEKRTLASQVPAIFRRAALFRPGFIGAWTYWLLLCLAAPALAYVTLRTVARAAAGELGARRVAGAVALIAFANGGVFATLSPAFQAPDEPDHFGYVQHLAETGHRPALNGGLPALSTEESLAMQALRLYPSISHPEGRPPWRPEAERAWRTRTSERPPPRDDGGGVTTAATHKPVYYGLAVPAYAAARSSGPFAELWAVRLISALLAAITAACAFGFAREIVPRAGPAIHAAAGLLVALLPQFGFMSGAVNNDAAVNAGAAATLFAAAWAYRRGLTLRAGLALGAALALASLAKQTGYGVWPAALFAAGVAAWRSAGAAEGRRDWRAALTGAGAVAAGLVAVRAGWAVVDHFVTPAVPPAVAGQIPGASAEGALTAALDQPRLFASYLWQTFLPRLPWQNDLFTAGWPAYDTYIKEGFASLGWYAMEFPNWVYRLIVAGIAMVVALVARAAWLHRREWRAGAAGALITVFAIGGVIAGLTAVYVAPFVRDGELPEQGRYAFIALAAFAAVAAFAGLGVPERRRPLLAGGLVAAMLMLTLSSWALVLQSFYT